MANLENLKKVREAIQTHRQNFHYEYVFSTKLSRNEGNFFIFSEVLNPAVGILAASEEHSCGTCACIVGFCASLFDAENKLNPFCRYSNAVSWLGLSPSESDWLFVPQHDDDEEYTLERNESEGSSIEHLTRFEYDPAFPGYANCTQEQGYNEALRRLDFLIEHYSKEEQNGGSI